MAGSDPQKFRKDVCGAMMVKSSFGKDSQFGWEVDHILSISKEGKDDLPNLQPLHWQNNESKGDDHPEWICALRKNWFPIHFGTAQREGRRPRWGENKF